MPWSKIIGFPVVSKSETEVTRLLSDCLFGFTKLFFCEDLLPFVNIKSSRLAVISPKDLMLVQFVQFCQYRLYSYKPDFIRTFLIGK